MALQCANTYTPKRNVKKNKYLAVVHETLNQFEHAEYS